MKSVFKFRSSRLLNFGNIVCFRVYYRFVLYNHFRNVTLSEDGHREREKERDELQSMAVAMAAAAAAA